MNAGDPSQSQNEAKDAAKLPPWKDSTAKKLLHDDIVKGNVTNEMAARQVYEMRMEYMIYPFEKFRTNLRNLLSLVSRLQHSADVATIAHQNFLTVQADFRKHAPPELNPRPVWNKSEAQRLLHLDVKAGLHLEMAPQDLWQSRDEYQQFTKKAFRDHLSAILRQREQRAYTLYKKEAKKRWTDKK